MAIQRPYRRNCRQFSDGEYAEGGRWQYVLHAKYAQSPEHYIRGLLLLQKDMQELFDFIEPAETNLQTYSYRTHEMLLRACVEVEANCKAILVENGYTKPTDMNMGDYRKIDASHRLSSYRVRVPTWHGSGAIRSPFAAWSKQSSLPWYRAYNDSKHDRHSNFHLATFENVVDAMCGLVVVISAQFYTHDFSPGGWGLLAGGPQDGMDAAIGEFFRIEFPSDFPDSDRYNFNWQKLKNEADPFENFNYTAIA